MRHKQGKQKKEKWSYRLVEFPVGDNRCLAAVHMTPLSRWLHCKLRATFSFHVTRHDAGQRRAVRSPSLEESILKVVADSHE
ncbi:hypothetical protein TNCV_3263301 [Trichonephila clavipes]|nr:hypothetical protein TNCV_3263301 [Trichonephila clavipes]